MDLDENMDFDDWIYWVKRIAKLENRESILEHFDKHINEFSVDMKEEDIENWIDSMVNIICIYREMKNDRNYLHYRNMVNRFLRHQKKLGNNV